MAAPALFCVELPPDVPLPDGEPVCWPYAEMPILATWYNPALGGMNCDAEDSCHLLSDGLPWSNDDYGHVAACIPEWHYSTVVTSSGTWHCRDAGSAVIVRNHETFGWVIHVDVLRPGPFPWGDINLIQNWRLE